MKTEEFKLLMKARQNVYDLLRCFFLQEPTEEFLTALIDENILKDLIGYNGDLDIGVELVSSALSSSDAVTLSSAIKEDFTRLFVDPLSIPLYESVYRSRPGLVTEREALAVRRKYMEAGLFIHPGTSFPEDHIGAEIEFIYYLCQKAAQADTDKDQRAFFLRQQKFLRDHLAVWVPSFCERLFSAARTSYFQGVAKMTQGFVAWDLEEVMSNFEE
jgi:putative dimethyl sulfoxide reductase chaperone